MTYASFHVHYYSIIIYILQEFSSIKFTFKNLTLPTLIGGVFSCSKGGDHDGINETNLCIYGGSMLHGSWFLPQQYIALWRAGKRSRHGAARTGKAGCGFSMAGRDVRLTITAVLAAGRRCLNYAICDFAI